MTMPHDRGISGTGYRLIPAGSNRGMTGQLLDSPRYRNSPSAEEYCAALRKFVQGKMGESEMWSVLHRVPIS